MGTFETVVVVSEHEKKRLLAIAGPGSGRRGPGGPGSGPGGPGSGPGGSGPGRGGPGGRRPVVMVCPNGIDMPEPLPMAGSATVAFVATMGWAPNTDAALWLGREIWPLVVSRVPEARLLLVGRDPTPAVRALQSGTIEVTGTVDDVRPYLARTAVSVAPLRSGGGTRLKLLESLGVERPVVSTTIGADGLEDLVGRGVVVADDAQGIADALVDLLKQPEKAADMGRAGHDAVASDHSWDGALAPLLEAVSR
jgi:polysaccharide biosynthesis protein PslH